MSGSEILAELARVKAIFQLRAIAAVIGGNPDEVSPCEAYLQPLDDLRSDQSKALCTECPLPVGSLCTMALCPSKRRILAPVHAHPNSAGRR